MQGSAVPARSSMNHETTKPCDKSVVPLWGGLLLHRHQTNCVNWYEKHARLIVPFKKDPSAEIFVYDGILVRHYLSCLFMVHHSNIYAFLIKTNFWRLVQFLSEAYVGSLNHPNLEYINDICDSQKRSFPSRNLTIWGSCVSANQPLESIIMVRFSKILAACLISSVAGTVYEDSPPDCFDPDANLCTDNTGTIV